MVSMPAVHLEGELQLGEQLLAYCPGFALNDRAVQYLALAFYRGFRLADMALGHLQFAFLTNHGQPCTQAPRGSLLLHRQQVSWVHEHQSMIRGRAVRPSVLDA